MTRQTTTPVVQRPAEAGAVEFRNVTRRFGSVTAVDDISFRIEPGTLVTLLGPSGCGKTTTLRMIAGLEAASEGQILIGGRDVTLLPATDRNVTMVFQSYALFPHMSVAENVGFGLETGPLSKKARLAKAEEGLALVGLAGFGDRLPSELSGGQQQRVAVARALVLEPEVLLFDEPLSNLDAKLRRRMREDIRDLQQKLGLTSVYVTHDQEEALAVSDRVILMNRSVIAQEGTPRELYERPRDRFVADFIGAANLAEGRIVRRDGEAAEVEVGPVRLTVHEPRGLSDEVMVAVRPVAIRLDREHTANSLPVEVRKATYLGSHMEYVLASEVGELFALGEPAAALSPGARAFARLNESGVALVAR